MKSYASEKNIYIWFGEEITFYTEIHRMLEEQKSGGNIKFAITSENQPCNSSDVLFPFDKFSGDVLQPGVFLWDHFKEPSAITDSNGWKKICTFIGENNCLMFFDDLEDKSVMIISNGSN